jgi:sec-independent protein translocase protein TatA
MFGLGLPEMLLIFVIIVLIFGTSRIPELGKGLGEGIRNFKKAVKNEDTDEAADKKKT